MDASKTGIVLKRAELKALLLFSSKDKQSSTCGVQFVVKGSKLFAYATDGRRSIEAVGKAKDPFDMEAVIDRRFLAQLLKLTTGSATAKIMFDGSGNVHRGAVDSSADDEIEERHDMGVFWEESAANHQASFPSIRSSIKIPKNGELTTCFAMPADVMSDLSVVGKAVGKGSAIDCYTPSSTDQPVVYRIGANTHTVWTVALATYSSEATAKATKKTAKKASDARQLQLEKEEAVEAVTPKKKTKVSKGVPPDDNNVTSIRKKVTAVKAQEPE